MSNPSKNRDKKKEYSREYRRNNPELIKEYSREYYRNNQERIQEHSREYRREYRRNNLESIKEYSREYRRNNLESKLQRWRAAFKLFYEDPPSCMVCERQLSWKRDDPRKLQVMFDHRHGEGKIITVSPAVWYRSKRFTRKNWKIWQEEDFGILCGRCNTCLPTDRDGRKHFIDRLIQYARNPSI